ncbi:MAG: LacI family transcriptional regulator [Peptococcaceae bacterium]|jgi:DNA-binding LacI/PurR family transcriptional regulator|nr:LacI family transcriptional regulator [Peptococcaceae bacterium]
MTLKEIAAEAGVSPSTVSRIINSPDDSFARKEVRDRVWSIIQKHGYIPNQNARKLKLGQSGGTQTISGSLAVVLGRGENLDDNPFFAQVARAIEQEALSLSFPVSLSYSIFAAIKSTINANLPDIQTDGAIVLGRLTKPAIDLLARRHKTIVYVGRNILDVPWDQIICDGYEATQVAMKHLVNNGHKRVAYLGETENETRFTAYQNFVAMHGLDTDRSLICSCQHNGESGYTGAGKLLAAAHPIPTAVYCAADVIAIAALRRFREARIKIPQQLSLISIDNIELSGYVSPMLTTVGMPIIELGNIAVKTLIDRINKRHTIPMKIYLPNTLIRRESVATPHGYVEDYII